MLTRKKDEGGREEEAERWKIMMEEEGTEGRKP